MAGLTKRMSLSIRMLLLSIPMAAGLGEAAAQETFPSRPITVIVPYPAGGGADPPMRIIAEKAATIFGRPVIVDNRAGGNGVVGAMAVKGSAPDGYTIFMGHVGTHGTNQFLMKLPYDPIKDFVPITALFTFPTVLVVPEASKAKSVAELAALIKAKSGDFSFASPGVGSGNHIMGEMFRLALKSPILHVPYRGVAQAVPDLVAGRTDMMFVSYIAAGSQIEAKTLRPLAVAGTQRLPALPNTPTMAEAGFPTVAMDVWFGLLAPDGTPPGIVNKLWEGFAKAAQDPEVKKAISKQGAQIVANSPAEFKSLIAKDTERLGAVIREAGIKGE